MTKGNTKISLNYLWYRIVLKLDTILNDCPFNGCGNVLTFGELWFLKRSKRLPSHRVVITSWCATGESHLQSPQGGWTQNKITFKNMKSILLRSCVGKSTFFEWFYFPIKGSGKCLKFQMTPQCLRHWEVATSLCPGKGSLSNYSHCRLSFVCRTWASIWICISPQKF